MLFYFEFIKFLKKFFTFSSVFQLYILSITIKHRDCYK